MGKQHFLNMDWMKDFPTDVRHTHAEKGEDVFAVVKDNVDVAYGKPSAQVLKEGPQKPEKIDDYIWNVLEGELHRGEAVALAIARQALEYLEQSREGESPTIDVVIATLKSFIKVHTPEHG